MDIKMNYDSLPWVLLPDGTRKINEELYDVINYVKPYLPENPIILEAGASTGEDTMRFKETWPKSIIHCFEPVPSLFGKLQDRVLGIKGIAAHNFALSISFYDQKFNIAKSEEISSLFPDNFMNINIPQDVLDSVNMKREDAHDYDDTEIIVKCMTINTYCNMNNIHAIDFMWLDTEGAELKILQGASNILSRVKVVSCELNFQQFRKGAVMFDELYDFMIKNNFELKYIWGRDNWQGTGIFINKGAQ
jgi:FkbM family methyltransferase